MSFSCGIVGLPNVGKSTLFNAITRTSNAQAANYPFCTIEPNIGKISVPDQRLEALAKVSLSEKITHNQLKIVDIAGLVKGASEGEGLGNKFLSNIREVTAIIHVLRCFEDDDVRHVSDTISPIEDATLVEMELVLADIQSLEKRLAKLKKNDVKLKILFEDIIATLGSERNSLNKFSPEDLGPLNLLSAKPVLYICNVEEQNASTGNKFSEQVGKMASECNAKAVIISAKIEEEVSSFEDEEECSTLLQELGLKESGLSQIVKNGYEMLNLIQFFTIGPKEARAWPIVKHTLAPGAAGVIHSDFEKGFIKAEVIKFQDYIEYNGELGCKQNGKIHLEGSEYEVIDGDIMHFKFNC